MLTERQKAVITEVARSATTGSIRISPTDILRFACPGLDIADLALRTFGPKLADIERENEVRREIERIQARIVPDSLLTGAMQHLRSNPDPALASACWAPYMVECERTADALRIDLTDDLRDQLFNGFAVKNNLANFLLARRYPLWRRSVMAFPLSSSAFYAMNMLVLLLLR